VPGVPPPHFVVVQAHPARLVREVLDHVFAQVVADLIRVPPGAVQQPLYPLRIVLADGLGQLPAVLALDLAEQPEEVALRSLPGLRSEKTLDQKEPSWTSPSLL
jgi:hypothetical protein